MNLNQIYQYLKKTAEEDLNHEWSEKQKELDEILQKMQDMEPEEISLNMTSVRSKLLFIRGLLDDTIEEIEKSYR
jgi:hypothetical protein